MLKTLIFTMFLLLANSAPINDKVNALKGFYDFSKEFQMYSGYLTIQSQPLINVHYLFITSKNTPATDDVVVWLNGGPGCSSLLGFLQQLGPHLLFPGSDKLTPSPNPYSWNNNASILFLQSPPGVGFSLNKDTNYLYNDTRTAQDNMQAIKQWYKLFPQYQNNNFWISGQSYCGMYIPILADLLLKNKNNIIVGKPFNFKGIMIGNGVMLTQLHWRRQARNTFYSHHYFYSPQIKSLIANCKYDSSDNTNWLCKMGNKLADQSTKRINPYNAIGICYQNLPSTKKYWYSAFDEEMYNLQQEQEPSCSSDSTGITNYLNDPDVQNQLHISPSIKWQSCNDFIGSNFKKDLTTINLFQNFKKQGLKVLLYSGNVDAQVSYIQTQEYIKNIGWALTSPKRKVLNPRGSLQGWISQYDGLTFYIINAAGHMVPTDKPNAALKMFNNFRQNIKTNDW